MRPGRQGLYLQAMKDPAPGGCLLFGSRGGARAGLWPQPGEGAGSAARRFHRVPTTRPRPVPQAALQHQHRDRVASCPSWGTRSRRTTPPSSGLHRILARSTILLLCHSPGSLWQDPRSRYSPRSPWRRRAEEPNPNRRLGYWTHVCLVSKKVSNFKAVWCKRWDFLIFSKSSDYFNTYCQFSHYTRGTKAQTISFLIHFYWFWSKCL